MTPAIAKEFRPLLLPCGIATAAAVAMAIITPFAEPLKGGSDLSPIVIASFLLSLSPFFFFGCIVILTALSFGAEFQEKTLPLLLAQPVPRNRTWNDKTLTLTVAVTIPILLYVILHVWAQSLSARWFPLATRAAAFPTGQTTMVAAFLLTTFASAGFWTLTARSTIGGMAFTLAAEFIAAGLVGYVLEKIGYSNWGDLEESTYGITILICSAVLAPVLLWLGRRKFARLEIVDGHAGEASAGPTWLAQLPRLDWLRCRPTGALLNLIRKELRLHKPIGMIAVIFTACWIFSSAMWLLIPSRHELFEAILNVMTAFYIPLISCLAGCMSLGEERTLGIAHWNLTLPISIRRQWLVKLLVGICVVVFAGWLLPGLLSLALLVNTKVGLMAQAADNRLDFLIVSWSVSVMFFLLSFWAVTFLGNTVRAALNALIVFGILGAFALCGTLIGSVYGLQTRLLIWLTSRNHWSLGYLDINDWSFWLPLIVMGPVTVALIVQTLLFFRRAQIPRLRVLLSAVVLCFLTWLPTFWISDFVKSTGELWHSCLMEETVVALRSLTPANLALGSNKELSLTSQDLDRTGKLSDITGTWIKGATISVKPLGKIETTTHRRELTIVVRFEARFLFDGHGGFSINYEMPRSR